jgi:hypothetical protein
MTLSKREKSLLILAVIVIVGVSLGKFVIQPGLNRYLAIQSEIKESEHELHKSYLIIRDKEKYESMLEKASLELEMVKNAFYQNEITKVKLELMEEVDRLILENGLAIKSKEVRVENPEKEPVSISYRASLSGKTANLVDFLESLILQDKLYQLRELEIKSGRDENRLNIYLVIETYCMGGKDNETESKI